MIFKKIEEEMLERLPENTLVENFGDYTRCENLWISDEYSKLTFVKSRFESLNEMLKQTKGFDDEYSKWNNVEKLLLNGRSVFDGLNHYRVISELEKCVLCGSSMEDGLFAISRRDKKTKICGRCGEIEAFEDLFGKRNGA